MSPRLRHFTLFAFVNFLVGLGGVRAQDVDEVTLTFGFPAVGQVYIDAAFKGDRVLIASSQLLSVLMIPHFRATDKIGMQGSYPELKDKWEIDPVKMTYTRRGEKIPLKADFFHLSETDLFLSPAIFQDIFDFDLTINTYALLLSLTAKRPMPIEEKLKREALRRKLKEQAPENVLKDFPMLYPRQKALIAGAMFDYNIGMQRGRNMQQYSYLLSGGMEILGGDIQGNVAGVASSGFNNYRFSNVRYRHVFKQGMDAIGNPLISDISIGQLNMTGPLGGQIRGVSVTNTPIVPRRVLDLFAIEGFTNPDSEVELLIAGQLVDFTRADELGYYRFTTPISYGTVRITVRIYTPQGEIFTEERQLQIPFTFVPRGVVTYNIQAGYEEFPFLDSVSNNVVGHGDVAYGVTNNLTIRAGLNRRYDLSGPVDLPYGSASLRILDQYLFNIDILPNSFVKASGSVFYANNTSFNFQYTDFGTQSLEQIRPFTPVRDFNLNYFFPFTIANQVFGFRTGVDQIWITNGELRRIQADLNGRLGPFVARINYREELLNRDTLPGVPQRLFTGTFTYTVPRTPGIPVFARGMFFRTQLRHDLKAFDATAFGSLQFSQTIFKTGRLTIGYDRDILGGGNMVNVAFLYDLSTIRSSTQTVAREYQRNVDYNFTQNLSGSIGTDLKNGFIQPTNRDQVGRSAITVRMFIDENGNGIYEKGEEIVSAKAVRLDQSATLSIGRDGLLRVTQLQSYWTYRLTVDVNALPDATLTPLKTKFSFVADPNRFKLIDIPLYRTGTIEGMVYTERGGGKLDPQPGIRLYAMREGTDEPLPVIRTFSDGSFYAHGLIPGNYTILVDTGQLAFMGMVQHPDTLKFTIRPTPEGDWIDTLKIILRPPQEDTLKKDEPMTLARLERMLGNRLSQTVRAFTEAQEAFYRGQVDTALARVDESLENFTTDFGLALKGSLAYLLGNKRGGTEVWTEARVRNPFVTLPDTTLLPSLRDTNAVQNVWVKMRTLPQDTIEPLPQHLVIALENQLGGGLRASVRSFTEAQELFYRRKFMEAMQMVDSSLNQFPTDHALALKGSIAYVLGRRQEAWSLWYEARERNPMIELPDTEVLDRITSPLVETNSRNGRKKLTSN